MEHLPYFVTDYSAALTGVKALDKHGYCPYFKDIREWNGAIQKMIDAFELMKNADVHTPDEEKTISEGLELFCKHFRNLCYLFTVCCSIPTLLPTFVAGIPSAFSSTARHLIRKQCFAPTRYPFPSSCLCASVNSKRVVILISNVYFTLITRTAA